MIGKYTPWVEETSSGKLRLCCRYDDELTGKRKKMSVALPKNTKKAIGEAENKLREKIEKTNVDDERAKLTLSELVKLYEEDMKHDAEITVSTEKRNKYACKALVQIIGGDVLVSKLHKVDILGKLTKTGESAKTKNNRLKRFRALIHWAYRHEYIDDIQFLERLKDFKTIPHKWEIAGKYLEHYEYWKVRDAIRQEHHRLFFQFMVLTGLRTGEALALEKSDIDIENRVIHITKSYDSANKTLTHIKTACSVRDIDIQPELLELLKQIDIYNKRQELRTGVKSSHLFHKDNGERRDYFSFRKHLQNISEKEVGRDITPHALRHTHASFLAEQGFSLAYIKRRLGHDEFSKVTEQIYIHVTEKQKQAEREKLRDFRIG